MDVFLAPCFYFSKILTITPRLPQIGFIWSVADHAFEGNVQELKEYHAEHNKFDVPVKTNKKLAAFVSRVRSAYANKQEGRPQHDLTDDKINQLNAIGFKWDFKKSRKRASAESSTAMEYDTMYNLLLEFKQQYGHTKVNRLIKEWQKGIGEPTKKEFRRLPVFLTYARKQHIEFQEGRPSMLDAEKIKQLSELGVEWKMPPNVPRKNSGGEGEHTIIYRNQAYEVVLLSNLSLCSLIFSLYYPASRKKKPKLSQELELNVDGMATAGIVLPALPSPDPNLTPGQNTLTI